LNVLVVNCGSSTLKFQIVDTDLDKIERDADTRLARGIVERIGGQALVSFEANSGAVRKTALPLRDHRAAVDEVLRWLGSAEAALPGGAVNAVGHRVVHGGERFQRSVCIDEEVLAGIEDCIELAPLHNPANLKGIKACRAALGDAVPQVAVFDTAFHATVPEMAFLYGIPYQLYRRHKIRRYGFHGTSHRYVSYRYRMLRGIAREQVNVISLHLGNGSSACAIRKGDSIDTSMGFTPLEGLLMGTRSGDLDASVVEFLAHKEGMTLQEIDGLLNKQSGLLGLSGLTPDMRDLLAEEAANQDRRAHLAIEVFCYRARKYVGAYYAAMGGADALIFTAGIGENSPEIRSRICAGLECLGLTVHAERNQGAPHGEATCISTDDSRLAAWVIPTNEELLIARDSVRCVENAPRRW
jgi:acetate kinase